MAPLATRSLRPGGKWTAVDPVDRAKHFEIVALDGSTVELRCVRDGGRRRVTPTELEDSDAWLPGWR